jgi:hypothetical protein
MGVMALVFDGGLLMVERRHAQAVADASALAAVYSLYDNYATNTGLDPTGTAASRARSIASGNGYTNDGVTSTVTVNIPPLSGPHAGTRGYAEALVQYNQSRAFSALWSTDLMAVNARAAARGLASPYSSAGIILLDPASQGALALSGSVTLTTNATVIVDSSRSKAVTGSSTASVTAPEIDITGGYSLSGSSALNGNVVTGKAATADPLANIPAPDPASLPVQGSSGVSITGGPASLSPGLYKGGISISGGAAVTLQPGIYYMQGGGFTMSSSSSLTGAGVMIYNDPVASGDVVTVTGSGSLNLSPPTSGTYAGITLFQNRASSAAPAITGGSNANLTGTFYFAGARLSVTGSSGMANLGSQYISKDLTITGSGTVNLNWGNGKVARKRNLRLVE